MSDDIKKGLLGIVVDETTISQVMPEINSLTYRGYTVQELCDKCSFEEVAYLVLNGEYLGIYTQEEFYDKRLLEHNSLRESAIVWLNNLETRISKSKYLKYKFIIDKFNFPSPENEIKKDITNEIKKLK